MASVAEELDRCLSYALKRLGTPELQLKAEQRSAIESVYRGKDVFVWLPTGFGKSICYQTFPFVFDSKLGRVNSQCGSVVLVVSPLIALMVDQVVGLRERGVNAAVITTGGGVREELRATENDMSKCSLLYCAPEALISSRWREALENPLFSDRVVAVVVDEAHCVSKWSKDFDLLMDDFMKYEHSSHKEYHI